MRRTLLLLLLAVPGRATPVPVQSWSDVDKQLLEMDSEIARRAVDAGGEITQNVKVSSSLHVTGNAVISGAAKIGGALTTVAIASATSWAASYTISATAFGACVTDSTVTITGTGGPVMLSFAGEVTGTNAYFALNVLEDGGFISPHSLALGMTAGQSGPGGQPMNAAFSVVTQARSSGAHSYCLASKAISGTPVIGVSNIRPSFSIVEIK